MTFSIIPYTSEFEEKWDDFCDASPISTFLQTRKFLNYHGSRFIDHSLMIMESETLVGILPAGVNPRNPRIIVSHPGTTFGGIIHQGQLFGTDMLSTLELITEYYKKQEFELFIYKPIPYIYTQFPAQDDIYAMFRLGARKSISQLSSTIDLRNRRNLSTRRRRSLAKAVKFVTLTKDFHSLTEYWEVLSENLNSRHSAKPVHSLQEMEMLHAIFPDQICLYSASRSGKLEAGVIVFKSHQVWHCQYIASSKEGRNVSALDAIYDIMIRDAESEGMRYLDFGTSNEAEGTQLNEGLYRYKTEFGGGGVEYQVLELELM